MKWIQKWQNWSIWPELDVWAPNKVHNSPTVMSEGPEYPKSPHKLVLQENVSISAFYMVILGEMDPKVAKLVNLAQI